MSSSLRCRQCKNKLVQVGEDGTLKLRLKSAVLFKSDGSARGACYWCNTETDLPLQIDRDALRKAEHDADEAPRFIIRRKQS